MDVVEVGGAERGPGLIGRLVAVWEASVRATHRFLSEGEIARLKGYVPQALAAVPRLFVAVGGAGAPVAFMGIDGEVLEMLFVTPEWRGKGIGKRLVRLATGEQGVARVTVNEQNPQALGFYERLGFRVERRTPLDGQGKPYPLLYLRLPPGARV